MKKSLLITVISFILYGCSAVGGFTKLEDGSFLVSVHSNAFASQEGIAEEFDEESKEACNGSAYTIKKKLPHEVKKITTYANGNATTTTVLVKKQVIECT